jgi:hypothetical protein
MTTRPCTMAPSPSRSRSTAGPSSGCRNRRPRQPGRTQRPGGGSQEALERVGPTMDAKDAPGYGYGGPRHGTGAPPKPPRRRKSTSSRSSTTRRPQHPRSQKAYNDTKAAAAVEENDGSPWSNRRRPRLAIKTRPAKRGRWPRARRYQLKDEALGSITTAGGSSCSNRSAGEPRSDRGLPVPDGGALWYKDRFRRLSEHRPSRVSLVQSSTARLQSPRRLARPRTSLRYGFESC